MTDAALSRRSRTPEIVGGTATDLGLRDIVGQTTTTVVDVDGDGVADIVEQTTTTAYDIDGDGVADIVESSTVTGVDEDGDGSIDEDEVTIDAAVAVSEDLVDAGVVDEGDVPA